MERNHTNVSSIENVFFLSYNTTGFNEQRGEIINDIHNNLGIQNCFTAVQEHWLLGKNKSRIKSILPNDLEIFSIGAFKNLVQVRKGRGIGGLAQIWHQSVDHLVTKLPVPVSNRVQGVTVKLPTANILWVNAYLPCDPGTEHFDETELRQTLNGILWLINNSDHDNILLSGDFNTDFSRKTRHTDIVKEFVDNHGLMSSWQNHPIDYTFESPCSDSTSVIDHFLHNKSMAASIKNANVIHRGDNISGHSPVFIKIETKYLEKIVRPHRQFVPRQMWKKATDKEKYHYKRDLDSRLSHIPVSSSVLGCSDVTCKNLDHRIEIDKYIDNIILCLEKSSQAHIPYTRQVQGGVKRTKTIPGWTTLVQPFKDNANFWYSIWLSAGKPKHGQLHSIMCHTRNKFKYAKRRCQNAANLIKRDNLVEACLNRTQERNHTSAHDKPDLFAELKKMKGHTSVGTSSKVDGRSDELSIAEHFRSIYKDLYNRTGSDQPLRTLLGSIDEQCTLENNYIIDRITPRLIESIIHDRIKPNKNDVNADITSDCLKNAPRILSVHISLFLKACLSHGYIPEQLLECALILIVKSEQKAADDSSNYRGIALSSLFLKIFDWVVLILCEAELKCDENQFGFQSNSSTTMCTWTVIEVINWFTSRGTPVYACLLDYRKAFDLVNHVKMFENLINRKVNPIIIRLMVLMYLSQRCYIKWGNVHSYSFEVTNGTRQGSVFSPQGGFVTYIDPLLLALRNSGEGCIINGMWYGSFFYADDGTLLSTSIKGLQNMVTICESHADANDLMFSTDPVPAKSKTKCMAFPSGASPDMPSIVLNGDKLPWVERAVHIGNTLHYSGTMEQDIREKRAIFIDRCMELNQEFHTYPPSVKLKMSQIYNSHFTGSALWDFTSDRFKQLCNSWNVNVRIMFELPKDTHSWLVEELAGGRHAKQMIMSRYIGYISQLCNNKRASVRLLFKLVSNDARTVTGSNIRYIKLTTGIDIIPGSTSKFHLKDYRVYECPVQEKWKIALLQSLIELRDGRWHIVFDEEEDESLNNNQLCLMIEDICR